MNKFLSSIIVGSRKTCENLVFFFPLFDTTIVIIVIVWRVWYRTSIKFPIGIDVPGAMMGYIFLVRWLVLCYLLPLFLLCPLLLGYPACIKYRYHPIYARDGGGAGRSKRERQKRFIIHHHSPLPSDQPHHRRKSTRSFLGRKKKEKGGRNRLWKVTGHPLKKKKTTTRKKKWIINENK